MRDAWVWPDNIINVLVDSTHAQVSLRLDLQFLASMPVSAMSLVAHVRRVGGGQHGRPSCRARYEPYT